MAPPVPPEADDDLDEVLDLEPRSGSSRRSRRRDPRTGRPGAVRPWHSGQDDEPWEDVVDDETKRTPREKPPVFWRARDSLYFEPLVALAIIVLLLVSLFAYTSNWPPVYVVESNSMQHGSGDHLGDINAGDIVLAQKVSLGSIVTYVDALATGYTTYGELGDVLIYSPNGSGPATPIIHRAILFLQYDGHNDSYNATGLAGLSCGTAPPHVYSTQGPQGPCGTTYLTVGDTLTLYDIGGRTVTIPFASGVADLGGHSGFLTLGDNNSYPDQLPPGGLPPLSSLVEPGWVIGVARGMIPWFGAIKLLLDGNAGRVPTASWEFLGLTISGLIFAGAGLHLLFRRQREARRVQRRRSYDEEEDVDEVASRGRRQGSSAVRPWKPTGDPPDEARPSRASPSGRMSYEQRRRTHFTSSYERRPPRRRDRETDGSDDDGSEPTS